MPKLKTERHHWWPRCVSRHWADAEGKTAWIEPNDTEIHIRSDGLGMIGNGHHIKLGQTSKDTSDWDSSFESEFDRTNSAFPELILWLEGLRRQTIFEADLGNRFMPVEATDERLKTLTECVTSLAVRGPMNREASVALAEELRGSLPERKRNALIGLNMQRSQRLIADSIGYNDKFAILYSLDQEFIYGDGFFHNVSAACNPPTLPKILAPITPRISVMISRPSEFLVNPKLFTLVLTDEEVERCNHAVQVYSGNAIFYRNNRPTVDSAFKEGRHLQYSNPSNPIDTLFNAMPGLR